MCVCSSAVRNEKDDGDDSFMSAETRALNLSSCVYLCVSLRQMIYRRCTSCGSRQACKQRRHHGSLMMKGTLELMHTYSQQAVSAVLWDFFGSGSTAWQGRLDVLASSVNLDGETSS